MFSITCLFLQFDRERIPERVVHARGASAKGFFEVRPAASMTYACALRLDWCRAVYPVTVFDVHSMLVYVAVLIKDILCKVLVLTCHSERFELWHTCLPLLVGVTVATFGSAGAGSSHSLGWRCTVRNIRLSAPPSLTGGAPPCAQVTHDISHLTAADVFRAPGVQTPVIVRFSTVIHERGSPETLRDPRGFAVRAPCAPPFLATQMYTVCAYAHCR